MEIFKEFFQTVNERLSNKVFGPFIISFLAWNWEPILLILASKNRIEFTINIIKEVDLFNIWNVLIIPMGLSICYSIAAGYLTNGIDWINKKSLEWKIDHKYENKDLEISKKLTLGKKEHEYQEILSGNATLADLNSKIKTMTENQDQLVNENNELRTQSAVNLELSREISELKISAKDLEGNLSLQTTKYEMLEEDFITSGLHIINFQLQRGNFKLVGVSSRLIQTLIDLKMINIERSSGSEMIIFSQRGILNYLKS